MDKYEETVVNPNISLNNFEVKVRDDIHKSTEQTRAIHTNVKKKDKNYQKSIVLLVLLAAIFLYQLSVSI